MANSNDTLKIYEKGLEYAIRVISSQPKTKFQIKQKLILRKLPRKIIYDIIKTLEEQGYIDDRRYAHMWVEERIRTKPIGRALVQKKLFEKGIPKEIIEEAITGEMGEEKEMTAAKAMARQKLERLKRNLNERKEEDGRRLMQKLSFFLSSRGFNYYIIQRVMDDLENEL